MERIQEGTVLNNRYEVGKLIGEGGMSIVYEGREVLSGAEVALKVLKENFSNDPERVEKLKQEAHALRMLRHPNIVKVYGIGHFSGRHYIAMQRIDGVTLSQILNDGGSLDWETSARIMLKVLGALSYTHSKGVIHKDIKPQNILVDQNGEPTLTDFGIAENRATSDTINAVQSNEFSVYYMSPEQARAGVVDQRSDIYSLGVTLYELLVGHVPFEGETQYAVALKIINSTITPAHIENPEIPRAISDVVAMATLRDPNKRFQSADEMISAINIAISQPDTPLLPDDFYYENKLIPNPNKPAENAEPNEQISYQQKKPEPEPKREREPVRARDVAGKIFATIAYIVGFCLAAVAIGWVVSFCIEKLNPKNEAVEGTSLIIDNYAGYKAEDIVNLLREYEINAELNTVTSDIYPSGYILTQSIPAGTTVEKGDTITLNVIARKGYMVLNDYVGKDVSTVKSLLSASNLKIQVESMSSDRAEDQVIKTYPTAGSEIAQGGTVTLYVSRGNIGKAVSVPELGGMTLDEAKKALEQLGLKVGNIYPQPGEDLTPYFEAKATPTPVPTETPLPTETPVPTPEITETPEATPSLTPEQTPEESPLVTPEESPVESAEPTIEPTPEITPEPTPTPTPTPEPTPTPSPTVNPAYIASTTVVSQYPSAGATLFEGDTVDIYFYDVDALNTLPDEAEMVLECPDENKDDEMISLIIFKYTFENGTTKISTMTNIPVENFPLTVKVPIAWGGKETNVDIYINDTVKIYEKRVVRYAEAG